MNRQTYHETWQDNRDAAAERSRVADINRARASRGLPAFPVPARNRASRRANGQYKSAGSGKVRRWLVNTVNKTHRDHVPHSNKG